LTLKNEAVNRKLKISILRFNPQDEDSVPRMQTYDIDEAGNMTLFIALNDIREIQIVAKECSPRHTL
jgi:fumarate reductase iron-sulfur subunit